MITINEILQQLHNSDDQQIEINDDIIKVTQASPFLIIKHHRLQMKPGFLLGTMDIKKHFGFLRIDDGDDVYIDEDYLKDAMQNDLVIVDDRMHRPKVVQIVSRGLKHLVCTVTKNKDSIYFETDEPLQRLLMIDYKEKLVDGHLVKVIIDEITSLHIHGYVSEIIGHKNDPDIETLKLVSEHAWQTTFTNDTYAYIKSLKEDVPQVLDFDDALIMTIDGSDAKDLDDAIHIKKLEDGFELGVHIADVSHYVKPFSPLDQDAFERTTSVYLANKVIPMLPHQLSDDLCSLNPHTPKKTLSCIMTISFDGEVTQHTLRSTWIQTAYRLTYDRVNAYIEHHQKFDDDKLNQSIDALYELSLIMQKVREKRGQLNLHSDELGFKILNEKVQGVFLRQTGPAEALIESMMLLANETVAQHLHALPIDALFRTHEDPDTQKLETAFHMIKQLGLRIPGKNLYEKATLKKVIDLSLKHPKFDLIHMIILRAMQKAKYTVESKHHYGLGATYYTHFTSPIRRYPDLIIHRLIHMYILKDHPVETLDMHLIAKQTSSYERRALALERDVAQLKSCEYLLNQNQTHFNGIIVHTMKRGMFVKISNGIEGFVSLKTMRHRLSYDEHTLSYYDRRGLVYRLGDEVQVMLSNVNIIERKIDFIIQQRRHKRKS